MKSTICVTRVQPKAQVYDNKVGGRGGCEFDLTYKVRPFFSQCILMFKSRTMLINQKCRFCD
jgi:hypothetical protein